MWWSVARTRPSAPWYGSSNRRRPTSYRRRHRFLPFAKSFWWCSIDPDP